MFTNSSAYIAFVAAVSLALLGDPRAAVARDATPEQPTNATEPQRAPSSDAATNEIIGAATAFLDSLSAAQKKAVLFAFFDDKQRRRWSNLPVGTYDRGGVRWGDLTDKQRSALQALLATLLSPKGVRLVHHQLAADDILRSRGGLAAASDWANGIERGSDYYYVSFVGAPSAASPWMLQFGGHHLAINATVVGSNVSLSPMLTGGHPVRFTLNGESVDMVGEEVERATLLFNSLTNQQRSRAVVGTRRIEDLLSGPGNDEHKLRPEGLSGREMDPAQRTLFLKLIEARLGIINARNLEPRMTAVRADLDETFFAWFGPPPNDGVAYWRVTGPRLVIEFSPQGLGGDPSNHLHNMYRDPSNDYGAAWTRAAMEIEPGRYNPR
jgi:hypothetical protein